MRKFEGGEKIIWLLVIFLIGFLGPIAYLIVGKKRGEGKNKKPVEQTGYQTKG